MGPLCCRCTKCIIRAEGPPLRVNRGRSGELSLHPRCTECIFRAVEPPSADRPRSKCVLSQRPRCTECIFGAGGGHFLLSVPGVDGFSLCTAQGGHLSTSRVICNFSELIPGATGHLSESIPGATGQVRVMCAFHSFYLARPPFPTLLLCLTHSILLYISRGWTASQFLIISHLTQLRAAPHHIRCA